MAYGAIGIGQTLWVYAIAALFNAELKGSFPLSFLIVIISMMAYVGTGFCIGINFARRAEDVNSLIAAIGVPLLLLSGAFVPIEFFPKVLYDIAQFNPIYHMIAALAAASVDSKAFSEVLPHLRFLVGFAGLMIVSGWVSYRQMLVRERKL